MEGALIVFYTYLYLRDDGTPYYVGKGTRHRITQSASRYVPVPSRDRIIVQEFETEQDVLTAEIFLISYYGRKDVGTGVLRNLTDGGDGVAGHRHTLEARQKISRSKKGRLVYRAPHKEYCVNGHQMSDDNIYIHPKRGSRSCKRCQNIRCRTYQRRKSL